MPVSLPRRIPLDISDPKVREAFAPLFYQAAERGEVITEMAVLIGKKEEIEWTTRSIKGKRRR